MSNHIDLMKTNGHIATLKISAIKVVRWRVSFTGIGSTIGMRSGNVYRVNQNPVFISGMIEGIKQAQ